MSIRLLIAFSRRSDSGVWLRQRAGKNKEIQTERVPPKYIQGCSLLQGNIARRGNRPSKKTQTKQIVDKFLLFFFSFLFKTKSHRGEVIIKTSQYFPIPT